jgi:hypothetical protein
VDPIPRDENVAIARITRHSINDFVSVSSQAFCEGSAALRHGVAQV